MTDILRRIVLIAAGRRMYSLLPRAADIAREIYRSPSAINDWVDTDGRVRCLDDVHFPNATLCIAKIRRGKDPITVQWRLASAKWDHSKHITNTA